VAMQITGESMAVVLEVDEEEPSKVTKTMR
jgi:hypothetical protein